MQKNSYLIDDLSRVISGALGALGGAKEEVETKIKDSLKQFLNEMDYVSRDEFEITRELAQKSIETIEKLELRIIELEGQNIKK